MSSRAIGWVAPTIRRRGPAAWLERALDNEQILGYLLVAPVVLLLLTLVAYPFIISVSMALTDRTIGNPGRFIGLTNMQRLWQDSIYQQTVHNTLIYTAGATAIKLVAGFGLALLINERFRFRQAVRSAVLLPWIVPAALGTMAWLWIFAPSFSVLNWILIHLGLILSAGIFSFTLSWNEFIYALTFVTASSARTIPVGVLTQLTRADFYFWGPLMAGALLGSVPVALIYSFFVEHYAAGLTAGAVKG